MRTSEASSERTALKGVDVAIIGAGFAGLSAADVLTRAGKRVCLIEARERVGGRTRTDTLACGAWVDVGGQWIGPGQTRMYALAQRFNRGVWPMHVAGRHLLCWNDARGSYRGLIPTCMPWRDLLSLGWAFLKLEWLARRIPLQQPWQARNAAVLDQQTFGDWIRGHVRSQRAAFLIQTAAESVFAVHPDDVSLLHALFYLHSGRGLASLTSARGGAQQDRIEDGMASLSAALAAAVREQGADIHLSTPAQAITQDDNGVTIRAGEQRFSARTAIVATPPVLTRELHFSPALPDALVDWMAQTPPGRVIKCFAVYKRPFWRDAGLSGSAVGNRDPLHVAFDGTPPDADHGILVGFIEGREADTWLQATEAARRAAVLDCLVGFFGEPARDVIEYMDHDWVGEAWSRGCYAGMTRPGALTRNRPPLREPFGRVLWAGTETATHWNGYIEGAVRSGERAAAQALSLLG